MTANGHPAHGLDLADAMELAELLGYLRELARRRCGDVSPCRCTRVNGDSYPLDELRHDVAKFASRLGDPSHQSELTGQTAIGGVLTMGRRRDTLILSCRSQQGPLPRRRVSRTRTSRRPGDRRWHTLALIAAALGASTQAARQALPLAPHRPGQRGHLARTAPRR